MSARARQHPDGWRPDVRRLVDAAIALFVLGVAALAVVLNLPVRPPAGVSSPTGMPSAPAIVAQARGRVRLAGAAAQAPGAPARAVDFANALRGWALVGCGAAAATPCRVVGTVDGGLSWRTLWTAPAPLGGIAFADASTGFAWTSAADAEACSTPARCPTRLFATDDGGRIWRLRFEGGAVPWSSVAVAGPTSLWAVVGGELLHSLDGGREWALVPTPGCIPADVTFVGRVGIAVGATGAGVCALHSGNGGATWTTLVAGLDRGTVASAFAGFLEDVGLAAFVGGARGAAALCDHAQAAPDGARGVWLALRCDALEPGMVVVLRTVDGGAHWRVAWGAAGCAGTCASRGEGVMPLAFLGSRAWREAPGAVASNAGPHGAFVVGGRLCAQAACRPALDFLTPLRGFAATDRGVFATVDGGASWQRLWPAARPGALVAADLVTGEVGLAVEAIAPDWIVRTADGGRTWRPWRRLAGIQLEALDFLTPLDGFAYGTRAGRPVLLYTDDGGGRWRPVALPQGRHGPIAPRRLAFASGRLGIVVDAFGDAWRTADGGARWTLLARLPLGVPQALVWRDATAVYGLVLLKGGRGEAGGHVGIVASRDGGRLWTPLVAWPWPPARGEFAGTVVAARGQDVWTFAYGGLLHSADQGAVWREIRLPAAILQPRALWFSSRADGWLLGGDGTQLFATSDGGRTWRQIAGAP